MLNTIKVISNSDYVSANWNHPTKFSIRGTVSADLIYPRENIWWISRAIIQPKEYRNQGIGSLLLKEVIETITYLNGSKIYVIPGGYDQNTEKQCNFYLKNGFILCPEEQNKSLIYFIKK